MSGWLIEKKTKESKAMEERRVKEELAEGTAEKEGSRRGEQDRCEERRRGRGRSGG